MAEGGETSNHGATKSVVADQGLQKGHCGYCNAAGYTSVSHGLWAFDLTVNDYQELLDRGWRRSGCYLYQPDMKNTCCPSYTIRLKAGEYVPSKEQARVLKKMRRFLDGKIELQTVNAMHVEANLEWKKNAGGQSYDLSSGADLSGSQLQQDGQLHQEDTCICYLSVKINDAVNMYIQSHKLPSDIQLPKATVKKVKNQVKKKLVEKSEDLVFSTSISFQIAAALNRLGMVPGTSPGKGHLDFSPNIIAEELALCINQSGALSGFSVKAQNGHLNFYSPLGHFSIKNVTPKEHGHHLKVTGDLKYDQSHYEGSVQRQKGHQLEIRMKRSDFDPEEYALYRKYQIRVHNDKPEKVSENSYRRFLVDTPLIFQPAQSHGKEIPSCGFGSFHQQYLIDGKLVAVGVVDILPKCLSSKYLFWDPDFSFLSLGKYSAMMEINWVKETEPNCPTVQYYYLGYYIHSCNKMRYKATYHPSELLCPVRYQWVPFHIVKPSLDRQPYVVLSDIANVQTIQLPLQLPLNVMAEEPCKDIEGEDFDEYTTDEDEEMNLEFEPGFDNSTELDSEIREISADGIETVDKVKLCSM